MSGKYISSYPLTEIKPKISNFDDLKIKNLENRMLGPNSEGKLPSEYQKLEESDIEKIKTKILLRDGLNLQNNNKDKKDNSPEQKNNNKNTKNTNQLKRKIGKETLDYLMRKKEREISINENIKPSKNNFNNETNNNISNLNCEIFSSSHNTSHNNLFKTNYKPTKIKDYYTPTSNISRNLFNSPSKNKNNKNDLINNKNELEKSSVEEKNELLKLLKEKDNLIEEKNKEILKLKENIKYNENTIKELKEFYEIQDNEIKRCRLDIIQFLKEIQKLKRQQKKKWLYDQEYKLGKILGIRFSSNGQIKENLDEGEAIIELNEKLEMIKLQKEELEKQKRKYEYNKKKIKSNPELLLSNEETEENESKDLINFKMNLIQKEENELKEKKSKLEIEKSIFYRESLLYNQETNCIFSKKKEGFPLLDKRYQIIGLIGKGGYSEVYKAYDIINHNIVACKLHQLNQNWKDEIKDNYIKHTIRENQIHQEFNHHNIVKHYGTIDIDNNSFCTILEYCTGPDLATYLQKNKNIQEKEGRIIMLQILQGLEYLNKLPNKIIHYDLKPENIIFNNMEIKISDFGLAKIIENDKDKIQLTSKGVGTYWYLPPECFQDKKEVYINSKIDIWSCGVILYEIFFKQKPFGQNMTQERLIKDRVMQNARIVEFPNKPSLSEDCKNFIKKCLEFRQEDRYDVFQALNSPFIKQDKKNKKNDSN
jgi:tousled-like kinase